MLHVVLQVQQGAIAVVCECNLELQSELEQTFKCLQHYKLIVTDIAAEGNGPKHIFRLHAHRLRRSMFRLSGQQLQPQLDF